MNRTKIDPLPGTHISNVAELLVATAPSACDFNGIELTADVGTTAADVLAEYDRLTKERYAAWEASPEGVAFRERQEWDTRYAQRCADDLCAALPRLDFNDLGALISWLERAADHFDHIGVKVDRAAVVKTFADHGFLPNVNCGPDFVKEDEGNVARWLIGQALDGIDIIGAPHGVIHRFAVDWRAKFRAEPPTPPEPEPA